MAHTQQVQSPLTVNRDFAKSCPGVLRVLQILFGAAFWITIASSKYEGSSHFAVFVAVFFWLMTLALYFLTLLDKQDLVPILGGNHWLLTNLIQDVVATALYAAAIGIVIYKTEQYSFCNVEKYRLPCYYKVYLVASAFGCVCAVVYLISAIYFVCRKCRGGQIVI
ncbi:MARVEL domain-containing protein 1 [Protopterus annectens]|uniref:MARVEL domain-containing protein 1 n=1 Tax=Protopterus annectens TaxID=7888 RepID=UPI001CFB1116|nr:MARVEL domain-containing protein 1 [Protopterus annectens]